MYCSNTSFLAFLLQSCPHRWILASVLTLHVGDARKVVELGFRIPNMMWSSRFVIATRIPDSDEAGQPSTPLVKEHMRLLLMTKKGLPYRLNWAFWEPKDLNLYNALSYSNSKPHKAIIRTLATKS